MSTIVHQDHRERQTRMMLTHRRKSRHLQPGIFKLLNLPFLCHLILVYIFVINVFLLQSPVSVSTTGFNNLGQTEASKSIRNHEKQPVQYDGGLFLTRLRRQTNTVSQQTAAGQAATSGSSSSTGGGVRSTSDQADSSSLDAQNVPEIFTSIKCDFGTADTPDLCKFIILDNDPINSIASWTLGSGRLALFQGGPLLDASGLQVGSNETNGGYIFYETSNPFVATTSNNLSYPTMLEHGYGGGSSSTTSHVLNYKPVSAYSLSHDQIVVSPTVSVATSSAQMSLNNNVASQYSLAGPSFMTPNLTAPGPSGMCLSFQYSIQGLSADELRIYLSDRKTGRSRQIWSSSESAASNWTKGEVLYSVTSQHSLIFSAVSSNAMNKDIQQRKFRGHLALDDIDIQRHDPLGGEQAACKGHCNLDGDLCGWTNGEDRQDDDFDWSFGRSSDNLFTGPARDYTSSLNNELTGSFLFVDSGYPRRPGDRALLMSPMFQPTAVNDALCMKFAVHMFGGGIGSLAIKIRYADDTASNGQATGPESGVGSISSGQTGSASRAHNDKTSNDLVVWEMLNDAGNNWHQAQTSVSSSKSPFQVLIEGVIGENHLGNIAIDEISFSPGPCPTSPPVASKNYGDCTFEQSLCYWRNPDADIHLDDLDWIRQAGEISIHGPNFDHTLKRRSGSYLKLENTLREPKSGTRAFLLSPVFQPKASGSVQCLSFYYYMFMRSVSSSGPNLGTIRVYLASNNELVPIWRLTNPISSPNWKHARASLSTAVVDGQPQAPTKLFQIAFEGIWGDAASGAIALDDITVFDGACEIMPIEARSVPGECTFDIDLCSWSNKSASYQMGPSGQTIKPMMANDAAILDSSRSPFLQSVGSGGAGSFNSRSPGAQHNQYSRLKTPIGWQLANVDSRPVNLQDHTYRAPIGYVYVDIFDSSASSASGTGSITPLAYHLQSNEVTIQSGQQYVQCFSFWFAAYGRQDSNQLGVYLTQASAPPVLPEDGTSAALLPIGGGRNAGQMGSININNNGSSSSLSEAAAISSETEQANAWKSINGKLLWNIALSNVTESQRRKWLYGQVTVRADSNHIIRFSAISNDGGFALDDISYFNGACETRPSYARVQSAEDEATGFESTGSSTGGAGSGISGIGLPRPSGGSSSVSSSRSSLETASFSSTLSGGG